MQLHTLGIDYHHSSDFSIERPNGSGDNLIIIFKSVAEVRTNGEYTVTAPDTAIVYSKTFPQYYRACADEFINHWIHFDIEDNEEFLSRVELPINTIVTIPDIDTVEKLLMQLSLEAVSDSANKSECIDLLLRLIIAKLGGKVKSGHSSHHYDELRNLRAEIYRNPAKSRSIAEFAEMISLSPSHFQALYKSEFGISCYEDVLRARLDMAKYYLKNTVLPINRIAELCGYENDVHFIRQFKARTGITAGEYRKRHRLL